MTDVAKLQISIDSSPVLQAATNLTALSTTARRTEKVLKDVSKQKIFGSLDVSAAEGSFKQIEGIVLSFSGTLDKVSTEFTELGASLGSVTSNAGNIGVSFEKVGTGLARINESGGTKALGKVVSAIKTIGTASEAAEGPVGRLAGKMSSLRNSAQGISTSGNSFKTSLGSLVGPADSAAGKLERTATAAAALSATLRRLSRQGGRGSTIKNLGTTASEAGAAFRTLSTPVSQAITGLGTFQQQIATIVSGIGQTAQNIGKTKGQFDSVANSIALLGDQNRLKAINAVSTALLGFGKAAKRAQAPLKTLVEQTRNLREAGVGLVARTNRLATAYDRIAGTIAPVNQGIARSARVARLADTEYDKLKNSVAELRNSIGSLQKASGSRGSLTRIAAQADAAGASFQRAGLRARVASNFIRQFATGLGLVGGGFAAALGIKAFVETLADFELQAAKTAAVAIKLGTSFSDATAQAAALQKQARELGASTRFTAVEAAEAQFFLARAGFQVNEVLESTPATLNLAAAGYVDLGEAADIASNVLQQFRLETFQLVEVTDSLVSAANNSNTSVRQLAQALAYSGPFASSLGVSVDEATAAIGALGNAGIQGSLAGTNLRGILISLVSPSRKAGETLDKLASRIGSTRDAFNVSTQGLEGVILNLRRATRGSEDASAVFAQIFNRRNVSGALALTKNIEQFSDLLETIGSSAGEAERIANQVDNTLTGAFLRARSAAAELSLSLGERGIGAAIRGFTDALANGLRFLSGSEQGLRNVTSEGLLAAKAFKVLTAAIAGLISGGALLGFTSLVVRAGVGLASLAGAAGAAAKGLAVLRAGWLAFSATNPVALLLTAATATLAWTTDLFGLLGANDDVNDSLEESNILTREQIQLREDLKRVLEDTATAAQSVSRAGRLREVGTELSTVVAESSRAIRSVRSLRDEARVSPGAAPTFGAFLDLVESAGNFEKAANILQGQVSALGALNIEIPNLDEVDTLVKTYREAAAEVSELEVEVVAALEVRAASDSDAKEVGDQVFEQLINATSEAQRRAAEQGLNRFRPFIALSNLFSGVGDDAIESALQGLGDGVDAEEFAKLGIAIDEVFTRLEEAGKIPAGTGKILIESFKDTVAELRNGANDAEVAFLDVQDALTRTLASTERRGEILQLVGPKQIGFIGTLFRILKDVDKTEREVNSNVASRAALRTKERDAATEIRNLTDKASDKQKEAIETEFRLGSLTGARLKSAKARLEVEREFRKIGVEEIPVIIEKLLRFREQLALDKERNAERVKEQKAADNILGRIEQQVALGKLDIEDRKIALGLGGENTAQRRAEARAARELLKVNIENETVLEDTRDQLEKFFLQLEKVSAISDAIDFGEKFRDQIQKAEDKLRDLQGVDVTSNLEKAEAFLKQRGIPPFIGLGAAITAAARELDVLNQKTKEQIATNNVDALEEEVELLRRKAAGFDDLSVARQTEIFLQEKGDGATESEIRRAKDLIRQRQKLRDEIESQTEANRKRKEQERLLNDAILQSQRDLATGLTDVAFGAKTAQEALSGFVQQLIRAIVQAKIFQALGATGLFASSGILGQAIGAGVIPGVRSYKGNVFSGGIIDNSYYSGGVPFLDQLPRVGSTPASFLGMDGSLNTLREGGSQEAILPLGRDARGRLGVRMVGGGGQNVSTVQANTTTNVTNVNLLGDKSNSRGLNDRQLRRQAQRAGRR